MSKDSTRENIVVVGGGLSGATFVKELSAKLDHSKYNLILVEARPRLVYIIGGARMTATSDNVNNYLLSYDKLLPAGKGTFKQARVEKILPKSDGSGGELEILLTSDDDGDKRETLSYRFLVLATGSKWTGPIDFPDKDEDIHKSVAEWKNKFKNANDIVIVGGGSVGIELAGELRDEYPEKKITIIHGPDKLLNDAYSDRFRRYVESQLRTRKIDLRLGERVDQFPPSDSGELVLKSGEKLNASLVARTSGPKPNTEMIGESLGTDVLTDTKYVKVLSTLQLRLHPSIFALGDIIDWVEQKQAFKSKKHASVIAANILSLLQGSKPTKEYKTGPEIILVTNGKNGGAMYMGVLWGLILGNWVAKKLKAKDLGLSQITPWMPNE